jgi:hypothetical protein
MFLALTGKVVAGRNLLVGDGIEKENFVAVDATNKVGKVKTKVQTEVVAAHAIASRSAEGR